MKDTKWGWPWMLSPVAPNDYETWVQTQDKERRIITVMGRAITTAQISAVSTVITDHDLNIDSITRMSGRRSLKRPFGAPHGLYSVCRIRHTLKAFPI